METLEEMKQFKFDGYSRDLVDETMKTIVEFQSNVDQVWKFWLEDGIDVLREFKIDFEFYSPDKEGTHLFKALLEKNNYNVKVNTKRMLFIFKGYELKASLSQMWTLYKLRDHFELLGLLSRKYNLSIEGYGAFSSQHNKK